MSNKGKEVPAETLTKLAALVFSWRAWKKIREKRKTESLPKIDVMRVREKYHSAAREFNQILDREEAFIPDNFKDLAVWLDGKAIKH